MKDLRRYVFTAAILAVFVVLPNFASALTADEIQAQINALMAQIKQLQAQLSQLQAEPVTWCHDFNVNLKIGNSGSEVVDLQNALNKEGFDVGSDSKGNFDEGTAAAVSGFQQKYKDEILTPLGLKYGTGFVGKATRAKLNQLYGCGVTPLPVPPTPPPFTCTQIACASNQKTVCPAGLDDRGCPLLCKCVPITPPTVCEVAYGCAKGYTGYDTGQKDSRGCPIIKCIPPTQNQPPIISGVSGPTTLKVNETGTWTVKASDPEQGALSYSVRWGDENITGLYSAAQRSWGYTQSAEFTHSYATDGIYNPTFIVTDNQGLGAKTSISAQVGEITPPTVFEQVKCVFTGSTAEQKCYSSGDNPSLYHDYSCFGKETCVMDIKGIKGDKITWKSTCGGYAYTTMDGESEYAKFSCPVSNVFTYTAEPVGALTRGQTYTFSAKVTGAPSNSRVYFYLQRPDGTMKYNGYDLGTYTDANGNWNISITQKITIEGKNGTWISWVSAGGQAVSNKQYHYVARAATEAKPDLVVKDIQFNPNPAIAGTETIISFRIVNEGNASATGGITHKIESSVASSRSIYDDCITNIGLSPGAYCKVQWALIYSSATISTSGAVRVDSQGTIPELDETNNTTTFRLSVVVAATPSITVLSPNGGESWAVGTTQTIKWQSIGVINGVILNLTDTAGNVSVTNLVNVDGNPGSANWTIPTYINPGKYKIVIHGCSAVNCTFNNVKNSETSIAVDSSDAPFSIVAAPSITVLSPNGGEQWQIGSTHTILWTPYSYNPDVNPANQVSAYLEKYVTGNFVTAGKVVPAGKASIHWIAEIDTYGKYAEPGDYYIRVINNTTGFSDRSNNSFKLVARGTIKADLKVNDSDGPLTVPPGGYDFRTSWTSNAQTCAIYNNSTGESFGELPPSGEKLMKFMPNYESYEKIINLYCVSKSPIEGTASDNVMIPSIAPSLTVFSPNGGEIVSWSSPSNIKLQYTSAIYKVSIALYKNDTFFNWIAADIPLGTASATHEHTWLPSNTISSANLGNNIFKIYVIGYKSDGTGTVEDKSDAAFSIVAATTNCVDSDGGKNYYTKGYCTWSKDVSQHTDSCTYDTATKTYTLHETYCDSAGNIQTESYKCPSGCNDGACTPTTPSITVLSPNGQAWQSGTNQTIQWTDSAYASNVYYTIFVTRKDGGAYGIIANQVYGTSFVWNVGTLYDGRLGPLASGETSYHIQIVRQTAPAANSSNSPFTIISSVQPSITVLSPNGGEQWQVGKDYEVKWNISGTPSSDWLSTVPGYYDVSIKLYKGGNFVGYISTQHSGSKSLWWNPNYIWNSGTGGVYNTLIPGNDYSVRVSALRGYNNELNIYDTSDAAFSIVAASQPVSVLSISLDASTPLSQNIMVGNTNVEVAKFKLSANSVSDIKVTSITVKRGELGACSFQNLKLYDGLNQIGLTIAALDVNCTATFWTSNFIIPKSTSKILSLKIDVPSSAKIGDIFTFQLAGISTEVPVGVTGILTISYPMTLVSATPSITVLSPNGGETWQIGSTQKINWTSTGTINGVIFYLTNENLGTIVANLVNVDGNPGSANWTIPTYINPGKRKIVIHGCSAVNCTVNNVKNSETSIAVDMSDAPFSIVAGGAETALPVNQTANILDSMKQALDQIQEAINRLKNQ